MSRTACKLCKHLEPLTSHGCRKTVEYRCLKKCLKGPISEMRALANEMHGQCPEFERKYQTSFSSNSVITSQRNVQIESKSTSKIESYLVLKRKVNNYE